MSSLILDVHCKTSPQAFSMTHAKSALHSRFCPACPALPVSTTVGIFLFYLQVLHVLHAGLSWLSTFVAPGWTGRFPSLAQVGQMLGPCFAWNPPDRPSAAQIYEAQPFVLPGMVQRVRNHGNCRNSLPVFLFNTFCRFCREDQCSGKQKAWTLFGPSTEEVRQFSSNCVLKA